MSDIRYRPEVDGLRAVAILPVLLFHLGYDWIPGGYLGVDVFFVISGFLITSILSREMESGRFSFARFWGRRVRRILPALLFVTAVTLVAAWCLAFPTDRIDFGRQATATLLSVANFYFWRNAGDYWGGEAENSPFLHAWSLAVEEQFYVLFPLFLYALHRWDRRRVSTGLGALIAVSAGLFLWGIATRPAATFYLLPTRAWELAVGGFLATLGGGARPSTPGATVAGVAALAATVASYFAFPSLGAGAFVPVIGAAVLIAYGAHGPVHALLSHPWLVGIGRASYSLYLWHWPVIVLSRQFEKPVPTWVVVAAFSALAAVSYFLVEEPLRRRQNVMRGIGVAFGAVLAFALASLSIPAPRIDTSRFETLPEYSTAYELHPRHDFDDEWKRRNPTAVPQPSLASPGAYRNDGVVSGPGRSPPRVVVLGDSHGLMWAHPIRLACEEFSLDAAFYCMGGVPPFIDFSPGRDRLFHMLSTSEKRDYDEARIGHIERWKPDVVFVCARWSTVPRGEADPLLAFLCRHAKRVVLIEQPPELMPAARNGVSRVSAYRGTVPQVGVQQYWPSGNVKAYEEGREVMRASAAGHACCVVMPTHDLFSQSETVRFLDGTSFLYLDDNHLTSLGASLALPRIRELLAPFSAPGGGTESDSPPGQPDEAGESR